jgi:ABC-2 type transport system permease protein
MNEADRRWWAIAKMTMRLAIKRKGFWIWAALSAWGYILMMAVFYFIDIAAANSALEEKNPILSQIVWKDQILNCYSTAQLMLFILSMLIGVGQIANDNRANALLIYLSKPCTKLDYLVGKWLGIFFPLYLVAFVPAMLFWGYIAMSFREYGSISSAPFLPLQIMLMAAVPAFFLSSLCVGISSLFKEGRLAGAAFAGVYFLSYFFSVLMKAVILGGNVHTPLATNLFYASVDGINIGVAKLIVSTNGTPMFMQRGVQAAGIERPSAIPILMVYLGLSAMCFLIAWLRIRPVEVVG